MKKLFALIVVLLLSGLLISGCGGNLASSSGSGLVNVKVGYPQDREDSGSSTPNNGSVAYYLIDVYRVSSNNTPDDDEEYGDPLVPTTRVDYPQTTAVIFGIPAGLAEFVVLGYNFNNELIYEGSSTLEVRVGENSSLDVTVSPIEPTPTPSASPSPSPTPGLDYADLSGRVTDITTGDPVSGVTVKIDSETGEYGDITDDSGSYSIDDIPAGTHYLLAFGGGIMKYKECFTAESTGEITMNILANPIPYRVSVWPSDSTGQLQSSNDSATDGSGRTVSSGGRYTVFACDVPNPGIGIRSEISTFTRQVFVHDRQAGQTILASRSAVSGTFADSDCDSMNISDNGRYITFTTNATNLTQEDSLDCYQIYMFDRETGLIEMVSKSYLDSTRGGSGNSSGSAVNDSGQVAFSSQAFDICAGVYPLYGQIFLHDGEAGTQLVSAANGTTGTIADGVCLEPSISNDGRFVAFQSTANNLVTNDNNTGFDVFVRDNQNTRTLLASAENGNEGITTPTIFDAAYPSISGDGKYVAFAANADLLNGTSLDFRQIYRRAIDETGVDLRTELVSRSFNQGGIFCNGECNNPSISLDGNRIAFYSQADDLFSLGASSYDDVFVKLMDENRIAVVSVDSDFIKGNASSYSPSISGDGMYVSFTSLATNLVPNDTNDKSDVFLRYLYLLQ